VIARFVGARNIGLSIMIAIVDHLPDSAFMRAPLALAGWAHLFMFFYDLKF
jgi:hypothetical protein